jgi:magnesium-transporting ATPase (P-type)
LHVLNCRSEQHSLFSVSIFRHPIVILTIIGNIIWQIIVMEFAPLSDLLDAVTIPFAHLGILFVISLAILPIVEVFKFIAAQFAGMKKTPEGVRRD